MYRVRVIWVGRSQDDYVRLGVEHYLAKIRPFAPVEVVELKPAGLSKGGAEAGRVRALETAEILKRVEPSETTLYLDERGARLSSERFAARLEAWKVEEPRRATFVIGGAFGFDRERLGRADFWSLSDLTLNHQLVRLVLLEQIYRGFTIVNGLPYHHP